MNRRSFFQRLALWFASLPVIHLIWSRPARSQVVLGPQLAPVALPAAVQDEVSERIQRVIDEAFDLAFANNRAFHGAYGDSKYRPTVLTDFSYGRSDTAMVERFVPVRKDLF